MFRIYRKMDVLLIEQCKRGNQNAQKQLFDQFASKMWAVCRRYISDRMEAEEVFLTGFTKVFDRIGQFRNEGSFEGWIRKIMVNESLGYLRKRRSLFLFSELDESIEEMTVIAVDSSLMAEELLNMVSSLPDGYRTVFNLYAIEGYSHQEIADLLGISEATSKSQLSRARNLLRQRLNKLDKPELNKTHHGKSDR